MSGPHPDLANLKENVKKIAINSGAALVGIGNQERLKEAPPSADMSYTLPDAQSCIIWVYPNTMDALERFLSKKDRMGVKQLKHYAYSMAWKTAEKISEFIEKNSEYKATPVIPNYKYRKVEGRRFDQIQDDKGHPDFSLRYGAVAAGLGHLGWSGNVVTKEFGGSCYLGGVLTTVPLEPDPMAEKNYCNRCKVCVKACTAGFFHESEEEDEYPVVIGGIKQTYAKREITIRCGLTCMGLIGESEDGTWSTWSANHICSKKDSDEAWRDPAYRKKLWGTLLFAESTPLKLRKHSIKIISSYGAATLAENAGFHSFTDMNPRCGNCSYICVADHKKRLELLEMLKTSGKVYIDDEGKEYVEKIKNNGEKEVYYPPTQEEYFKNK
jgi:NAD-dependent dihydropyrimidine dehydrogenase PreA subunit